MKLYPNTQAFDRHEHESPCRYVKIRLHADQESYHHFYQIIFDQ